MSVKDLSNVIEFRIKIQHYTHNVYITMFKLKTGIRNIKFDKKVIFKLE